MDDCGLLDPPTPLAVVPGQRLRRGLDEAPRLVLTSGAKAGCSTATGGALTDKKGPSGHLDTLRCGKYDATHLWRVLWWLNSI